MDTSAFKFSGEGAANYDRYLGHLLFEPYAIDMASRIDASGIQSVLELASGTGRVTRHLRQRLPVNVKLTATDLSIDMLEVAKEKLNDPSIDYQVADMQHLPFPDQSFDYVICQFGLMFLNDKQAGVREAYRVLKPGGKFIFSTWDDTLNIPLLKIIFNDTLLPFFKEDDPSRFLIPYLLHDKIQLENFMKEAGFAFYTIENTRLIAAASGPKDVVMGFLLKHSLGKEVADRDPAALEPMAIEMQRKIGELFGDTAFEYELSAFICTAER